MPHLNELTKKYAGKAIFTAVNIWEENNPKDDSYLAKVEKYVKDFGDGMTYNVAADDPAGTIAKAWMNASGSNGIPATFVVDGTGTLVWMGHPMELDKPLEELVAGTYDPQKEAIRREEAAKAAQERMKLFEPISKAVAAEDFAKAVAEIDKLVASKPEMKEQLAVTRFTFMLKYDERGAYAYGKQLADEDFKDNADTLNMIAWTMIDPETKDTRKSPDYKIAVEIAERANKVSEDKNPMIMDTLALAYWLDGRKKEAIALEERAVKIAKDTKEFDATMLKDIEARLAEWKADK